LLFVANRDNSKPGSPYGSRLSQLEAAWRGKLRPQPDGLRGCAVRQRPRCNVGIEFARRRLAAPRRTPHCRCSCSCIVIKRVSNSARSNAAQPPVPHSAAKTERPGLCGRRGWLTCYRAGLRRAKFLHAVGGTPALTRQVSSSTNAVAVRESSFHSSGLSADASK
jgi:hypothetical protein